MSPFFGRLSPEDRSALRQQVQERRRLLDAAYLWFAIVLFAAVAVVLLLIAHSGPNRRVALFGIPVAFIVLFFRRPRSEGIIQAVWHDPRPFSMDRVWDRLAAWLLGGTGRR